MWLLAASANYALRRFMKVIERVVFAEFTCIVALGNVLKC